jgi:peptidoglycan hydrolase-like protein with peptidoglycan-binding domain
MNKIQRQFASILAVLLLVVGLLVSFPKVGSAVGNGANGPEVYVIQGMLKSLGKYPGKIHGHYNGLTAWSVKQFQIKHGLPVTGHVNHRTLEAIMEQYVRHEQGKEKSSL